MRAIRQHRHLRTPALLLLLLAVLAAGCGKQDLYEPPGSPYEVVGRLALPSDNEGIAITGRTALVAGGEAGLHTIDWSDPANPQLLATLNTTKYADAIEVVRTFTGGVVRDIAHIVEGTEGVTSFDVTDPANPVDYLTGTTAVVGRTIFIEQGDDPSVPYIVYLAEDWKGVRIFESIVDDPGILAYNGVFVGTNGSAFALAVRDGWGYCADNEMGLCVLDLRIRDLNFVDLVSWADTPGRARAVALEGDHAFVADGVEGLAVFRIDAGATPQKVAQYDLSGFSEGIAVRDGLCALAANTGGVHFLDVSDPANPVYMGTTPTTYAMDVAFSDDGYCLAIDLEDGLYVLGGRGPFLDTTAPSPVTDLAAEGVGAEVLELTFTMTGDDRMHGTAAGLEIRMAEAPIENEAAWDAATPVTDLPSFGPAGTPVVHEVGGLDPAATRHFAVRVFDDEGRTSALSNTASAATLDAIVLRDGRVSPEAGNAGSEFTYSVEVLWGRELSAADVIIDGQQYAMSPGEGRRYEYASTLDPGEHEFRFVVAADGSDTAVYPAAGGIVDGPVVGEVFLMGSPADEPGRGDDEILHDVVLSYGLIAGETEVTQDQWAAVMDPESHPDPSQHPGEGRPVDSVTWLDAVTFCNALSTADGLTPAYAIAGADVTWDRQADGWRLPTEAEWEYLCRAGSPTAYPSGDITELNCRFDANLDAVGWYCGNGATAPAPVGQKAANDFGLYDMNGNLREWCWDWYGELSAEAVLDPSGPDTGTQRVCRGGSWYVTSQDCRSAARGHLPPDSADDTVGLRVVRTDFTD
jgi:formylglycine-generating enzyme required for sulfatase activity